MNLYDFYQPRKKINLTENMISASDVESTYIAENLHKWFKEKWVRFGPDGKIRGDCARGDDSEGKPKCLPRAKAHALGKKGRKYAAAKKRREDPNPERSGAAINVSTKKKKVSEKYDANPTASNVPQYKTWGDAAKAWSQSRKADTVTNKVINYLPVVGQVASALDTGAAAIQGDYKGAGRSALGILPATKKIDTALSMADTARKVQSGEIDPVKTLKGVLPQSETPIDEDQGFTFTPEQEKWLGNANRQDPNIIARMPGPKPPPSYFTNPQDQQAAQTMQRTQDLASRWQAFRKDNKVANSIINRIPGVSQAAGAADVGAKLAQGDLYGAGRQAIGMIPGARDINTALQAKDVATNLASGNISGAGMGALGIAAGQGSKTAADVQKAAKVATRGAKLLGYLGNQPATQQTEVNENDESQNSQSYQCPHCGGKMFSVELINEKKDACYYKVKSRYKVWPSAYASGALVKCRKRGAKNWGSKSESVMSEANGRQQQSFDQAFAAARTAAAATGNPSTGTFTWKDPKTGKVGTYQTNVAGEKYVAPAQQRRVVAAPAPATVRSTASVSAPTARTSSGVRTGPNVNIDDATRERARAAVAAATTPTTAMPASQAEPRVTDTGDETARLSRREPSTSSSASDILGGLAPGEFTQRMTASAQLSTGDSSLAAIEPARDPGDSRHAARLRRSASGTVTPASAPVAASSVSAPAPSSAPVSAPTSAAPSATSPMRGRMPRVGTDFYYVPGGNITDTGDETSRLARRAPAPAAATAPTPAPAPAAATAPTPASAPAAATAPTSAPAPASAASTTSPSPSARPITDREREAMAAANVEPETGFVPGTTGFAGSGETPDQAGAAIERPAAQADTTSEPGVSVSSDDLSPTTRQSFKPTEISPRVAYNFTSQNNNVKIDQNTLSNAIKLGLVDSTGKPDKEAIENWQRNNKLKVDGIIGPNTSDTINQKINAVITSPSGSAIQSGTPGQPWTSSTQGAQRTDDILRDLTPSQRIWAQGVDLTDPEILSRLPKPTDDELKDTIGRAESQKNPNLAFGDVVDRNGNIVSNLKDPKTGKPAVMTAEQWSKQNLGTAKRLDQMTLDEIMEFQNYRNKTWENSGAVGAYQFTQSTLARLAKNAGMDPEKTVFDRKTQEKLMVALTKENANILSKAGIMPNAVNLYMAHYVGGTGAKDIIADKNNPNKLVVDSLVDGWAKRQGRNVPSQAQLDAKRAQLLRGNPGLLAPNKNFYNNLATKIGYRTQVKETKHYFNIVGTDRKSLITEFKMQKDARGWYLPNSAKSALKLDAVRAFGIPLTEEEMNQAAYSGTAATLGVDNPKSPIGSISKSQRLNKRSRSK